MTKQQYEKLVECRECLTEVMNECHPATWYMTADRAEAKRVLDNLTRYMERQGDRHNWWDYSHPLTS